MSRTSIVVKNVVATLAMWFAAGVIDVMALSSFLTGLAVLIAFGATVALWLTWALTYTSDDYKAASGEKRKREVDGDARLALLLSLMDDEERAALKQRLVDDLSADGEALPLADLLAAQESNGRHQRTS